MKIAFSLLAALVAALVHSADYTVKKLHAKKDGAYEANAAYLVFANGHPLAGVINPFVKNLANKEHNEWIKRTMEGQKEYGNPNSSTWEQEIGMDVIRSTPRLVSIAMTTYDYSGGAHPNHWLDAYNFGVVNGKAKQLKLTDFFSPGFKASSHVSKLVINKLKKEEGADLVVSGEVKSLNAKQLQRFTVHSDGLTWYFNPYEVGPYAAGDFQVKLTLKELGPKFKRTMLAR